MTEHVKLKDAKKRVGDRVIDPSSPRRGSAVVRSVGEVVVYVRYDGDGYDCAYLPGLLRWEND